MKERKNRNERRDKSEEQALKEKQAWFGLATACAAVVLAVIMIIALAGGEKQPSVDVGGGTSSDSVDVQSPVEEDLGMVLPLETLAVTNEFGFYYNQTLDCYYHHEGVDFIADAGANVLAVDDGVVESIYSGDVLKGTEIVIDHGNGLKTCYRFVVALESLSVGDKVSRGDVIATVASATGDEYKDGAHLHFEIIENGETVNPAVHLSLLEK